MSEIFVSYARATVGEARQVADALRRQGFQVWLDDELPAHRPFSEVIEERLDLSKAVVVLWSKAATVSQWVRSEASRAREHSKLVQVTLDGHPLPMPFDQFQCADLSEWTGDPQHPEWCKVLSSLSRLIDVDRDSSSDSEVTGSTSELLQTLSRRMPLQTPARPSIAVLPFRNVTPDLEASYIVDAISEDIVTALTRFHSFFVIAANTSFTFKNMEADVRQVGRDLGVRYILEGSVRKFASRIRITAQLIDITDGAAVWADRFDRDLTDTLLLQDEIVEQVVSAIEPAILQREGLRISHKSLNSFNAIDCFYRGMWHLNKITVEGYACALDLFHKAIEQDPELALAHIGLARILFGGAVFGWSANPADDLAKARASSQSAIELEPRDAYGYFASAGASLYLSDHGAALSQARTAIQLNSNCAIGYMRLGQVLTFAGLSEEAIEPIKRCLRLSPFDPQMGVMLESLALAYYQSRNYDEAAVCAEGSMHHSQGNESTLLAASLAMLGRCDEAAIALPRKRWQSGSIQRPLAAPYARLEDLDHLREGVRLARDFIHT